MIFWKHWHTPVQHGYTSTLSKRHMLEQHEQRVRGWAGPTGPPSSHEQSGSCQRTLRKDSGQARRSLWLHPNIFPCILALRWGRKAAVQRCGPWRYLPLLKYLQSSSSSVHPATPRASAQNRWAPSKRSLHTSAAVTVALDVYSQRFPSQNDNGKPCHSCWEYDAGKTTNYTTIKCAHSCTFYLIRHEHEQCWGHLELYR